MFHVPLQTFMSAVELSIRGRKVMTAVAVNPQIMEIKTQKAK
jgi:hypothetical protein